MYPTNSRQDNDHGFGDSMGIILIDSTLADRIICQRNKQLKAAIKEERGGKLATDVLLLHDNAPVHKSKVAQVQVRAVKSPAIQPRPGPKWLLFISKSSPTCVERDFGTMLSSRLLQRLGLGTKEKLLFQRHRLFFYEKWTKCTNRLRAKKGPAPPPPPREFCRHILS